MRIGLYGGSFDPIHLGHLIAAQDAVEQVPLDRVLFIPCAQSPHKLGQTLASNEHRLRMLRLALRPFPHFAASRIELDRRPPSYAIDTVIELRESLAQAELYWLIGADQLPKLTSWKRFEVLREMVTFLVMDRPGTAVRRRRLRGVIYLPKPRQIGISSTEIRQRLMHKLPIDSFVPAPVARYLLKHRLYTPPSA